MKLRRQGILRTVTNKLDKEQSVLTLRSILSHYLIDLRLKTTLYPEINNR